MSTSKPINLIKLYKGESWEINFAPTYKRDFAITGTHACSLTIKEDKTTKIAKTITDKTTDNLFYKPAITPAESSTLTAQDYQMTLTITDSATNYEYQKRYTLRIIE